MLDQQVTDPTVVEATAVAEQIFLAARSVVRAHAAGEPTLAEISAVADVIATVYAGRKVP